MEDGDEDNDHPDVKQSSEQRKNRKRILLTRDPELYEMEDFYLNKSANLLWLGSFFCCLDAILTNH